LLLLASHATFERGGYGVEAGLAEMLELMRSGRWRVFKSCQLWLEEFRVYHRVPDRGVVKERDDTVAASRYAFMSRSFARIPGGGLESARDLPEAAEGLNSSPFTMPGRWSSSR